LLIVNVESFWPSACSVSTFGYHRVPLNPTNIFLGISKLLAKIIGGMILK